MSIELVPVPLNKLEPSRHLWLPFVEAIARRDGSHVEQKLADIYSGNVGIFLVWNTEKQKPTGLIGYAIILRAEQRKCKLAWATGRLAELRALYPEFEQRFRRVGFNGIIAHARPGWSEDLKGWGYRLTHMEYEKDF